MRSSMHMTPRSAHIYLVWEGSWSFVIDAVMRTGAAYVICQTLISIEGYRVVFAQLYPLFQFQLKEDLEGM